MTDSEQIERTRRIVEAALELKAERPVALDVSEVTSFADVVVVLSGRSDRQVRAIVDAIRVMLRESGFDHEQCGCISACQSPGHYVPVISADLFGAPLFGDLAS